MKPENIMAAFRDQALGFHKVPLRRRLHRKLVALFEQYLTETEAQIERVNEGFDLFDERARARSCKGMMGLVEQGRAGKEDAAVNLALIGAAQRVEHYEISG